LKPYFQNASVTLYHGDCFDIMPTFAPGAFAAAITDPPYGHNNNNNDLIARRELALGERKRADGAPPTRPIPNDGAHFIRLHTPDDATILDPFAGAGTAGVAAMRTGRRAVLIELEEKWCEMAAKRLDAEGKEQPK